MSLEVLHIASVSNCYGLLFQFIETERGIGYAYMCVFDSVGKRWKCCWAEPKGDVMYERMDGCTIYIINVESLVG